MPLKPPKVKIVHEIDTLEKRPNLIDDGLSESL